MIKASELETKIYQDLKKRVTDKTNPNKYLQALSEFSLNYQMNHHNELGMDYHEYFKEFFVVREEIEDYEVALGNATMIDTSRMFKFKDPQQLYKLTAKGKKEPININKLLTFIGNENTVTVVPVDVKDQQFAFHIIDSMVYQIGI